jgi:hypothetical protein
MARALAEVLAAADLLLHGCSTSSHGAPPAADRTDARVVVKAAEAR